MLQSTVAKAPQTAAYGLTATQSVNTTLTPNANSVTQATGDANNQTSITFQFQARTNYWMPFVNTSSTTAVLAKDTGNGVVTFKAGLTVTYQPLSTGYYNVLLDGQIVDSNTVYNFTGAVLATFAQSDS